MILFKNLYFVQTKTNTNNWGFCIKGYEYINGELYLISGSSNIKHNIENITDNYKETIIKIIQGIECF
jgi:hypothetical protein